MPWYQRWRNVFRTGRLNGELDAELSFHLAETTDRLMAAGLTQEDASRQARLRLGNYTTQRERTRDMNIAAWLDATRVDLSYALRQLRLSPVFTTVAVLSLALGIGANTAMFQLVNTIRLRMLPVKDPQELAYIDYQPNSTRSGSWTSRSAVFTDTQYELIRQQQQAFTGVLAWSAGRFNLADGGQPRFAEGLYVSGNFFLELGVTAALGRTLSPGDDGASCNAAAVISDSFWQREFGGDSNVLSRMVKLNGHVFPIIGVTPARFFGVEVGNRYDVAVPLCADRVLAEDHIGRFPGRTQWWLSLMGRLRRSWTIAGASAHLKTISAGIMKESLPEEYSPDIARRFLENKLMASAGGIGVSDLRRQYERPLTLLLAITGLVLLIACANLANLLLARATAREPEIALRLALGISRPRLVRQLLAESLLLAFGGAALGCLLATVISHALVAYIHTSQNALVLGLSLDWKMLGYTAGLALLTCLLFGMAPSLRAAYVSPLSALRSGSRSVTTGPERFSLRRLLVVTQIALSLVLLVGGVLFVRSLRNLMVTDSGFQPEGVLFVNLDFSRSGYAASRRLDLFREFSDRLSGIPGVRSVAQVNITPVGDSGWDNLIGPGNSRAAGSGKSSLFNRVSPGYFQTMGTRLVAGRDFTERDNLSAPKVAIINEVFAKRFLGTTNPVGQTFHMAAAAGKPEPLFQVVGLVQNTKYRQIREDFLPIAYFPTNQDDTPGSGASFAVRLSGSPGAFMKTAKAEVLKMNSLIGIDFEIFSQQLRDSLLREHLMATLSAGFAFLAAVLATLGIYGVIAYMVARRRNEIGVRIALGSSRRGVILLILREAVLLVTIGIAVGLVITLWAGQAAAALLFGLTPHDVLSIGSAALLLTVVALLASYLPARSAASLDPMTALRNE